MPILRECSMVNFRLVKQKLNIYRQPKGCAVPLRSHCCYHLRPMTCSQFYETNAHFTPKSQGIPLSLTFSRLKLSSLLKNAIYPWTTRRCAVWSSFWRRPAHRAAPKHLSFRTCIQLRADGTPQLDVGETVRNSAKQRTMQESEGSYRLLDLMQNAPTYNSSSAIQPPYKLLTTSNRRRFCMPIGHL